MKKIFASICMVICVIFLFESSAFAGSFVNLGNYLMKPTVKGSAWQHDFNVDGGTLTVKFRRVPGNNVDGRGHIILKMNGQEFYSAYCPDTRDNNHRMSVFKDIDTGRVFFALYLDDNILLWGYDDSFEVKGYKDSNSYYHENESAPELYVDSDGDLELLFTSRSIEYGRRYKLLWDNATRTFGYKDITKKYVPPKMPVEPSGSRNKGGSGTNNGGSTWKKTSGELHIAWE